MTRCELRATKGTPVNSPSGQDLLDPAAAVQTST